MGFFIFGLIKKLLKLGVYFLIFSAVIVLIPNLPPYTSFSKIELDPLQPLQGPLALNGELNGIEKLYTNKLLGPETFRLFKGELYTSLATGEIVKISPGGHITFVTKIGQPCTGIKQEHICGRPLGFTIDEKTNQLYVADAYYGIWKVDLKTDKKQLLVSPNVEIDGRTPKLFNSVALDSNGNLYWTDSTSDFRLKDGVFSAFSDPSGRLFSYDVSKNESKVLLDKLWFANGLAVSPDNQFVVVAETFASKIHKYYINGPKKGKSEVFVTGLPGTPDNVQPLPDGSGLLVNLYTVFEPDAPVLTRSLAAAPHARKFLARLQRLIEIPFEFLFQYYPHFVFEDIVYNIGNFKSISGLSSKTSGLLHIDWNGNIVASYYNTDGTLGHNSDAIVFNDKLYLGKPHEQNYIAAVSVPPGLKKAFTATKPTEKVEMKQESQKTAKPSQGIPKKTQQLESAEAVKITTPTPNVQKVSDPVRPANTKPTAAPPQADSPPKPLNQPKPEIPKAQEKKEAPKPVSQEVPKSVHPPKPAEAVKTTTPKPVMTTTQKLVEPVKVASVKPTEIPTPKNSEFKKPTPKPEENAKSAQTQSKNSVPESNRKAPQEIPIKEEIPSDTRKPSKETLKVIKKDGPTEIPNPNL